MNENAPAPNPELVFSPFGKRIVITRKAPDVGGLKLNKELERECSPDVGTIVQIGQIGFWNKWIRGIRPGKQIHFVKYSPIKIETVEYEYIYVDVDNILGISN
jgi:co-chaperonin GroES (HSP10)